jgi:colanic acid/amylovoran biosynthesis glycosyltransferase
VHRVWPHRIPWLAVALLPFAFLTCLASNPKGSIHYLQSAIARWGLIPALRRFYLDAAFLALRPDLIHFEFGSLAVGRTYLKELLDCRIVPSFRGYDMSYSGLEDPDYYKEVWQDADAIHLLGEDLWKRAQERGCPDSMPHALIPPSVPLDHLQPDPAKAIEAAGTPDRPLRVLSVGRLTWVKGYEYALQSIKLLKEQGIACEYRIVGDGDLLEGVSFARHQMGLENIVDLLGSQPWQEVTKNMQWADVFLQTSVQEGFCNAVIEAQAMKLPVVCSDAGGLPENIENDVTGFVVPRRNPRALADKLRLLANDPELRGRMGKAGRERVGQHFQLPMQIERFDQFYQDLFTHAR